MSWWLRAAFVALCLELHLCHGQRAVGSCAKEPDPLQPDHSSNGWVLLQRKSNVRPFVQKIADAGIDNAIDNDIDGPLIIPYAEVEADAVVVNSSEVSQPRDKNKLTGVKSKEWTDVRKNSAGDLAALAMSLSFSALGLAICMFSFEELRSRYPLIFEGNVLKGITPFAPSRSPRGWWHASMRLEVDEVTRAVGLDQAMLLEFLHMSIWLLSVISPAMICMCFLHAFFGKDPPLDDGLGRIDLANMGNNIWICWLHALLVWYVVLTCHWTIMKARKAFLPRRLQWLKDLPFPRATSILVERIPVGVRTDAELQKYFEEMFDATDAVHSSIIVKHTAKLYSLVESLKGERQLLAQAEFSCDQDAILLRNSKVSALELEVSQERARIRSATAAGDPSSYASTGFVTFKNRRDRETALCLRCTRNQDEMIISFPPDPTDIYFQDLQVDPNARYYWRVAGNALIVALFIVFLPICIGIASIARLQTLQMYIPVLHKVVVGFPVLKSMWDGLVASTILSCMLGFVPGMLASIFQCYSLRTGTRVEHYIQVWYFYFLVVFVLFVTVLGNSLLGAVVDVVSTTSSLLYRLATSLPMASHFYITYLVVQSFSYGLCLLRPVPLWRFISWRKVCEEDLASKLAEPEHDVYNSMGARTAVFAFHLIVALVFSHITPIITIVALVSFVLARAFYGYLVVFAEPVVPDEGGKFWCTALGHVQQGIFMYILLMSAIVAHRSSSWAPPIIALSSLFYHFTKYREFLHGFGHLDHLPIEEFTRGASASPANSSEASGSYLQPELQERVIRV